jgi:uncharacterized repeat protein (TIGR01451 family)
VGAVVEYTCSLTEVTADFTNVATVEGTPPVGPPTTDEDPSSVDVIPLGAIGDYVWLDGNANGLQDAGEEGIPGVAVTLHAADGSLLATTSTDATGYYGFNNLLPDSYYVEFAGQPGLRFSLAGQGGDDTVDSDALAPTLTLSVDDDDVEVKLGERITYTLAYANADPALGAANVVLSATIPTGTTFVSAASTTGWACVGGVCTYNVGTLAAGINGTVSLVVELGADDALVPEVLSLQAAISQGTAGPTRVILLGAGETFLHLDAGLSPYSVLSESTPRTPVPTGEGPTEQPRGPMRIFVPMVRMGQGTAAAESAAEAVPAMPPPRLYVPCLISRTQR